MPALRVVVRPVNYTSLRIRAEFTMELDRVPRADPLDAGCQVDVVRN